MLADRLRTIAWHSGTIFRAAVFICERRGINIEKDENNIVRVVEKIPAYLLHRIKDLDPQDPEFVRKSAEIEELASEGIARGAAVISQSKKVRDAVIKRVEEDSEGFQLIVVEGQGAGHVYHDQLSFFLTADLENRVSWRSRQTGQSVEDVRRLLTNREESDKSRVNAPLRKHPNSIEFRTDGYKLAEEAFEALYKIYWKRRHK